MDYVLIACSMFDFGAAGWTHVNDKQTFSGSLVTENERGFSFDVMQ